MFLCWCSKTSEWSGLLHQQVIRATFVEAAYHFPFQIKCWVASSDSHQQSTWLPLHLCFWEFIFRGIKPLKPCARRHPVGHSLKQDSGLIDPWFDPAGLFLWREYETVALNGSLGLLLFIWVCNLLYPECSRRAANVRRRQNTHLLSFWHQLPIENNPSPVCSQSGFWRCAYLTILRIA